MNFKEYAPLALRTAKSLPHSQQVQHAQLGMVTEIGELADMVKRHMIYGKDLDRVNGKEELGDYCWYLNLYCSEMLINPSDLDLCVAQHQDRDTPLTKATLMAAGLTGALTVDEDERGVSDNELVQTVLRVLVELALCLGTTLGAALETNIDKLAKRYGDKYSDYAALNRDLAGERAILERPVGFVDPDIKVG